MGKFILITGGARSGKSTLAENITDEIGDNIAYIATAIAFDDGMKDRIKKHRESRPREWTTIEKYKNFHKLKDDDNFASYDTVLLDCITLMVSNLLLEEEIDFDKASMEEINKIEGRISEEVEELLDTLYASNKNIVFVTNEVGMGLVPSYKLGNIFRDIAGRINQFLARKADEVYLTVSGIPVKIK
ncbi:bifunctional adenosylcobinamide kinase/adenosylcobinamide-phosphate guanylyltransferase [Sporosalibacterium faouarense]|uniref:bifunctional adenosylcobinamide kinase/adenosylcobinamide-phosphate guanylyltransferase n=1 Tax=Sporosalibacterium faouarense TaxID=516123 RepID=UPI00141CD4D0|nr:bifunctional adenosylcobinamide kinase/adenosylcobinamide-phosphate guanylyltransferase [Sporosalibacterium faouarense]MTI46584.1 bifunctional adenosylcobinamide kinase/adenosylcobinamide-phosphate guanylyltransferase [Bacillota bacterium]